MTQLDTQSDSLHEEAVSLPHPPSIDYDALAEALTPIISAIIARQVNQRR